MTNPVSSSPTFWEDFRRVLRQTRTSAGFSQDVMASALGINRSTYTYYESGKTAPDLAAIRRIADILQVPVEIFIYPEQTAGALHNRAPRVKPTLAPETIGQLTREEQELIARFRAQGQAG